MNEKKWQEVDLYITRQLVPPDPVLETALKASSDAGLPAIHVAPNQGKFLFLLALLRNARNVLEIGTLGGYSTIWLARALPPDGHLTTLEFDPKHSEVARTNIANAGLAKVVEVRVGRAIETLPKLASEGRGPFDLVFIDADKPGYPEYLAWALKLTRKGSLIIADNVVREGAVVDERSDDPSIKAIRRFYELLANEPRVSATAIQTVGSKGYDGFAVALVVADPDGVANL